MSINMESADLAKEIDTALGATYLHLHNSGACSTVQVGRGRNRGRQEGATGGVRRAPRSQGRGVGGGWAGPVAHCCCSAVPISWFYCVVVDPVMRLCGFYYFSCQTLNSLNSLMQLLACSMFGNLVRLRVRGYICCRLSDTVSLMRLVQARTKGEGPGLRPSPYDLPSTRFS